MRRTATFGFFAVAAAAAWPAAAAAHPGHGEGLAAGWLHPFAGLDHLVAAVAAGWWAATGNRRAGIVGVAAFLAALGLGMAAGAAGFTLVGQEAALAGTALALGALLAAGARTSPQIAAGALAAVALVHGLAHGAENPNAAALLGIAGGTAALLGIGVGVGVGLAARRSWAFAPRLAGAAAAAVGAALLLK